MENTTDLQRRFEVVKGYRIEDGKPATDKDVWTDMLKVAVRNQDEALMDDMQGYVDMYQKRIQAISLEIAKLL